jgi:hypothetical protein
VRDLLSLFEVYGIWQSILLEHFSVNVDHKWDGVGIYASHSMPALKGTRIGGFSR